MPSDLSIAVNAFQCEAAAAARKINAIQILKNISCDQKARLYSLNTSTFFMAPKYRFYSIQNIILWKHHVNLSSQSSGFVSSDLH